MKFRRIRRLIIKELTQTIRDRNMLKVIFLIPVIQLFIFGYAVSSDINNISTIVLDEDGTSFSRDFIRKFVGSGYFILTDWAFEPQQIDRKLETGEAQMALRIPRGFGESISRRKTAVVQTILDGTDSTTARIIGGYATEVTRYYSSEIALQRLDRLKTTAGKLPTVNSAVRVWYNPELKSVNFMIPGVLCLILFIVTTSMTSMAVVKEKELGTLEQLIVTPIKPIELMIGKTVPFLLIGLLDTILVLIVASFWFKVDPLGSLTLLFASTCIFLMTSLGLGIYISTVSQTQQEATKTTFFFMLPSILLTGFIFPIENMPLFFQYITYVIPLRYFLVVIRGIFLKGTGFSVLWPHMAILIAFGLFIITMSARRFSKRME